MRTRRILLGVLAVALAAGAAGRRAAGSGGDAAPAIVEAEETLRDALAAPPPASASLAAAVPSRVAVWASPALRRREAEKVLLSRRLARAGTMEGGNTAETVRPPR